MPNALHVLITRHAISPLFAMRTLSNGRSGEDEVDARPRSKVLEENKSEVCGLHDLRAALSIVR